MTVTRAYPSSGGKERTVICAFWGMRNAKDS